MRPDIMIYGIQGWMMEQSILTQHNLLYCYKIPLCSTAVVVKYPFARLLTKAIHVFSFSLSYPMTLSNSKEGFYSCTLIDLSLSWTFSIAPN